MADKVPSTAPPSKPQHRNEKKLPRLPNNARITKRPLLRPPIASPHTNSQQPKVLYISAKTPFIAAVKRVEKLLQLAEKRSVQSATTIAKQQRQRFGRRGGSRKNDDEILEIAEVAERQRGEHALRRDGDGGVGEEVLLRGTGKAVQRVLELGLWFQQREDRFVVRLRTGSVGAVDDVAVVEQDVSTEDDAGIPQARAERESEAAVDHQDEDMGEAIDVLATAKIQKTEADNRGKLQDHLAQSIRPEEIPESRIRYTSLLEVSVRRN